MYKSDKNISILSKINVKELKFFIFFINLPCFITKCPILPKKNILYLEIGLVKVPK
jgi:hypothetical protein